MYSALFVFLLIISHSTYYPHFTYEKTNRGICILKSHYSQNSYPCRQSTAKSWWFYFQGISSPFASFNNMIQAPIISRLKDHKHLSNPGSASLQSPINFPQWAFKSSNLFHSWAWNTPVPSPWKSSSAWSRFPQLKSLWTEAAPPALIPLISRLIRGPLITWGVTATYLTLSKKCWCGTWWVKRASDSRVLDCRSGSYH